MIQYQQHVVIRLQVVGSLTAGGQWDDDDSIDDDTATDGGEVSRLGSELSDAGAGIQNGTGYADQMGGGRLSDGLDDGFSEGAAGIPQSEDSGF